MPLETTTQYKNCIQTIDGTFYPNKKQNFDFELYIYLALTETLVVTVPQLKESRGQSVSQLTFKTGNRL